MPTMVAGAQSLIAVAADPIASACERMSARSAMVLA